MAIRGIDVSEWQGLIDWQKVKASGIQFAIIRYADGLYIDRYFHQNMAQAAKAGLHIGVYIYSRAINAAQAKEEARRTIEACKPYKYDMPIYIDLEEESLKYIAQTTARAFLDECAKHGVKGGIYANLNWFNNYINPQKFLDASLWLAQWNNAITARDPSLFGLWQYSSKGKINGINGDVDLDYCYKEYWKIGTNEGKEATNYDKKIDSIINDLRAKTKQTLAGKYGNGAQRQKALGDLYTPVQWIINRVLKE